MHGRLALPKGIAAILGACNELLRSNVDRVFAYEYLAEAACRGVHFTESS